MEKVLRRSILRRNHLLKRTRRDDLKDLRREWREHNSAKQGQHKILNDYIRDERKARREDWMLGPLAPNREAGQHLGRYGAADSMLTQLPKIPRRFLKGPAGLGEDAMGSEDKNIFPEGEWAGDSMAGNVAIGDRVVVIRGKPGVRGVIGLVSKIDHSANSVSLRQVNMVDFEVPSYMLSKNEKVYTIEYPIPISDIRHVVKLQDESGQDRDYVVKHLYAGAPYFQRDPGSNLPRHTRYVSGLDLEIPWPKEEPERQYFQDGDTPRQEVERETYTPAFDVLPMFSGVVDELRGKYSRDRTSHDDLEWMRQKIMEDAREDWLKSRVALLVKHKRQRIPNQKSEAEQANEEEQTLKLIAQMQSVNLAAQAGTVYH